MGDEFDDILNALGINDTAVSTPTNGDGDKDNKKQQFDVFKDDIEPLSADVFSFKRDVKTFYFLSTHDISEDIHNMATTLSSKLIELGYVFRYSGDTRSKTESAIFTIAKNKSEVYLPWKKFNLNVKPTVARPKDYAYKHAAIYHKKINDMSPTVKNFLARSIHIMLGEDLLTPLTFLICYSEDGAELSKDIDYKNNVTTGFFIKVCEDLDIPVFNLKNVDAKKRLVEYLKIIQ